MGQAVVEAPSALTADLAWLLARASHNLNIELQAALESIGLAHRAHCVLRGAMEGEYTQIELARLSGVDKTTMVGLIDELEAAGLAERKPSPTDRRKRVIAVTKAGEQKTAEADALVAQVRDDVLSALPAEDREQFMTSLMRLTCERLNEAMPCSAPPRRPRTAT
ncbi:MAG: MarR family transcriptional regulator [Solirubrobacteraceae bacterium]|nr:MarR family transcriptional regulator [Solirubrobacteraceae bacterium]